MNEKDWPVGTVATATVLGVEGVRVLRVRGCWASADDKSGAWADTLKSDISVTDVRPLVVLDLDDPDEFVRILRGVGLPGRPSEGDCKHIINGSHSARRLGVIADQIEAQVKPPRIPEPGWGGIVEAGVRVAKVDNSRRHWLRTTDGATWHDGRTTYTAWSELIDPVLIRPGIEDES